MKKAHFYINLNLLFDYDALYFSLYNLQKYSHKKPISTEVQKNYPTLAFDESIKSKLIENLNVVKPRAYGITFRKLNSKPAHPQ